VKGYFAVEAARSKLQGMFCLAAVLRSDCMKENYLDPQNYLYHIKRKVQLAELLILIEKNT
jgi:hypothetical protein